MERDSSFLTVEDGTAWCDVRDYSIDEQKMLAVKRKVQIEL